ncbi:MAG: DUF4350 domain-containing protein [Pyrinomonadaceae bacterium]
MRQRLTIFITVALVIGLLIALNATSYVSPQQRVDSELSPDRSTYNAGATGTRALFDFLGENGRKVMRWREAPAALLNASGDARPATFVVVGETLDPFAEDETKALLSWVETGGRLVLIDRRPDVRLLPSSGNWQVSTELLLYPTLDVRSDNLEEMTAGIEPARPAQPTLLTHDVDAVRSSKFAAVVRVEATGNDETAGPTTYESPTYESDDGSYDESDDSENIDQFQESPPPPPAPAPTHSAPSSGPQKGGGVGPGRSSPINITSLPQPRSTFRSPAPVIHLEDKRGALLVDYIHGAGRIIVLSDPYIFANGGISQADNLRLAVNTVAGAGGLIAFDEYHQRRGVTHNQLIAYFAGTPALSMLAQATLIVLMVLWTRGRRFARPLPVARVDRRSKLEFVASMAELQQRARAYDLAIENIYTRTRRVLARYSGLESSAPSSEIAARVAARSKIDRRELESLMRDCEDAIAGAPLNARQSLALVRRLREVERGLGLRMRAREIRQAKEM